jgi:hypothetical protein
MRLSDPAARRLTSTTPPRWVGGFSLHVGDRELGVVADDQPVLEMLANTFVATKIDGGLLADDFGVSTMRRPGAGPRLMPELLHRRESVLRSRSTTRLVRRLDLALGNLARGSDDAFRIRSMAALVRSGAAVLVPESLVIRSTAVERAIIAGAASLIESAALRLDPERGVLIALPGLIQPELADDDGLVGGPGSYELNAIVWDPVQIDTRERLSTSVARLSQLIARPAEVDRQEFLDAVVGLGALCRSDPITLDERGVQEVLAQFL